MNSTVDIVDALFGGSARVAILRVLAVQTISLTGRQVAELAGVSQPGAARALEHFAELGIVSRRRVGRAILHELERENAMVQSIILPVFEAERALQERLRHDLVEAFGAEALSVVLFGSVARGDRELPGDIDVLVVVGDTAAADLILERADEVAPVFFRRYGMPLSVVVAEQSALPAEPAAFLKSACEEGLVVSGEPLQALMPRAC